MAKGGSKPRTIDNQYKVHQLYQDSSRSDRCCQHMTQPHITRKILMRASKKMMRLLHAEQACSKRKELPGKAMGRLRKQLNRSSKDPDLIPLDLLSPALPPPEEAPEFQLQRLPRPKAKRSRWRRRHHTSQTFSMSSIIKTIWPQFDGKRRVALIVAFFSTIVFAISTPMFAFVFSRLMSTLYEPTDRQSKATTYSLAVLGVAIADSLALFVSSCLLQRCGQMWMNNIRFIAVRLILAQPRQFFDEQENEVSRLSECLDNHGERMQQILGRFLGYLLMAIVMLGTTVIWSLVVCWKLTLVLLACAPIMYAITNTLQAVSGRMDKLCASAAQDAGSIFTETFNSIKTVRSLTLEEHFRR